MDGIIPFMLDYWANAVVQFPLPKSSMRTLDNRGKL